MIQPILSLHRILVPKSYVSANSFFFFFRQDNLLFSFSMEKIFVITSAPQAEASAPMIALALLTYQHLRRGVTLFKCSFPRLPHMRKGVLPNLYLKNNNSNNNNNCLSFHLSFLQREEISPKLLRGFLFTGHWIKVGQYLSSVILGASEQVRRNWWLIF